MPHSFRLWLRKRQRKYRRPLEVVGAALLLLLLPVFLVVALGLLPFLLAGEAISERRRPCPHCGLRGTLRDVTPPRSPPAEEGEFVLYRNRVVTTHRWRCEVCEAEFEERDGQPLLRVPAALTVAA